MFINQDGTKYIRTKCLNKLILKMIKEIKISTLYNTFLLFTNDFDSSGHHGSGGRVI